MAMKFNKKTLEIEYHKQWKTLVEWCKELGLDVVKMHNILYKMPYVTFPEAIELYKKFEEKRK